MPVKCAVISMTSPTLYPTSEPPSSDAPGISLGSEGNLQLVDANTIVVHNSDYALTVVAVVNRIVEPDLEGLGSLGVKVLRSMEVASHHS